MPAIAQNPPPGEGAGAQGRRFEEETKEQRKEFEPRKTKPPEIIIEKEAEKAAPKGEIPFLLKGIKVTGSTVFEHKDLLPLYQSYLNQQVTFSDLQKITENIKAKYRQKGYFTTVVYLPEQDIIDGQVEIKVVEGKLGALRIEGNKYFSTALIEKNFHTKKNDILNMKLLERDLLRLNQNPDLEGKVVVSAGEKPETVDITLKVFEQRPWHLGVTSDNQGTRLAGKFRSAVYVRSTNASGKNDSFFANTLFNERSFGEFLSYRIPLDTYGTKFGLDLTYYTMKLGKEYKSFDYTGTTEQLTPYFTKELYLTEALGVILNLGMDIKSVKSKILGSTSYSDQMRIPYFEFGFDETDSRGLTSFYPRFNFGTSSFMGASSRNHPLSSREGTGGPFFKYEQSLKRTQRMPWESYITFNSRVQVASHTLATTEQLQLGGANSVRGYPEGDYLADTGWQLSLEWAAPMYLIPKDWKLPGQTAALRYQIEPVVFVDYGAGRLKKVNSGEKESKNLLGVGGGFRIRLFNKIYCRLDWASHLWDEPTTASGPSTFNLTFQAEL